MLRYRTGQDANNRSCARLAAELASINKRLRLQQQVSHMLANDRARAGSPPTTSATCGRWGVRQRAPCGTGDGSYGSPRARLQAQSRSDRTPRSWRSGLSAGCRAWQRASARWSRLARWSGVGTRGRGLVMLMLPVWHDWRQYGCLRFRPGLMRGRQAFSRTLLLAGTL